MGSGFEDPASGSVSSEDLDLLLLPESLPPSALSSEVGSSSFSPSSPSSSPSLVALVFRIYFFPSRFSFLRLSRNLLYMIARTRLMR